MPRRASTVSDTVRGACGNFASPFHSIGYPVSCWLLDLGSFAGSDTPQNSVPSLCPFDSTRKHSGKGSPWIFGGRRRPICRGKCAPQFHHCPPPPTPHPPYSTPPPT